MEKSTETPLPGQFLTIRIGNGTIPLLRRPFAFASFNPENKEASIIYEKRGEATALLSLQESEDTLDILTPLGNSFPPPLENKQAILIAGGIGMGPIFYFARTLMSWGLEPQVILGARTVDLIPSRHFILDKNIAICTDDGSAGFKGTVLDYLKTMDFSHGKEPEIYLCGPNAMMKAVHLWAKERGYVNWVSMEQTMGCAVGACMGCVVPIEGEIKYARVCKEGPVFSGDEISWKKI